MKKQTVFRIIKRIGITVAVAMLFTILLMPGTGQKDNARDKGIISYLVDGIEEIVQYGNHSDSTERTIITHLSWLENGFVATNNSTLAIQVGVPATVFNSEYIRGEETIVLKVTSYSEEGYSNYVEIDTDVEISEVVINNNVYNYTSNGGMHRFIWSIENCSYNLVGYNTELKVLKNIIKNNF